MSLPAWVDADKERHQFHGESYKRKCTVCQMVEALSIAWEALEGLELYGRIVHDRPKDYEKVAKEALRRIEELGGPVAPDCTCYGPQGSGHSPSCKRELWEKLKRA